MKKTPMRAASMSRWTIAAYLRIYLEYRWKKLGFRGSTVTLYIYIIK